MPLLKRVARFVRLRIQSEGGVVKELQFLAFGDELPELIFRLRGGLRDRID